MQFIHFLLTRYSAKDFPIQRIVAWQFVAFSYLMTFCHNFRCTFVDNEYNDEVNEISRKQRLQTKRVLMRFKTTLDHLLCVVGVFFFFFQFCKCIYGINTILSRSFQKRFTEIFTNILLPVLSSFGAHIILPIFCFVIKELTSNK